MHKDNRQCLRLPRPWPENGTIAWGCKSARLSAAVAGLVAALGLPVVCQAGFGVQSGASASDWSAWDPNYGTAGATEYNSNSSSDSGYLAQSSSSHSASAGYTETDPVIYPDGTQVTWQSTMAASSNMLVDSGQMHFYAQAQTQLYPAQYEYVDSGGNGQILSNPLTPYAVANASGGGYDTLHITSSTLPAGSSAVFQVTFGLDASVTGAFNRQTSGYLSDWGGSGDVAHASGQIAFSLLNGSLTSGGAYSAGAYGGEDLNLNGSLNTLNVGVQTFLLKTTVGSQLKMTVQGGAYAWAYANVSFNLPNMLTTADVSNTLDFSIVPLTNGVGYTTDSGNSYLAVPEPVPAAVVVIGGLGLLILGRRTARRRWGLENSSAAAARMA